MGVRKAFCKDCMSELFLVPVGNGYSHNGLCGNCGGFSMLYSVEINGGDTPMKQVWGTTEVVEYLRGELWHLKEMSKKKKIEFEYLDKEVCHLEMMILNIEKECEGEK
jgi:hypothetical protein